jgi:ring-1,2-phenylacetyl-CoA epoxidase subunit PaaD
VTATLDLPTRGLDAEAIRAALDGVADPEIPNVSIVELGMIGRIAVDDRSIEVELLPTFVGCPALELIRTSIEDRLADDGREVRVDVSFATPWTSDRISPAGREKLRRSGFAPPPPIRADRALPMLDLPAIDAGAFVAEVVPCPFCGSHRTTLESPFGPTQCRSIRHCADCLQPFEAFKPI